MPGLELWRNKNVYRAGSFQGSFDSDPDESAIDGYRKRIEPWLTAVFQSEHLSLLVGSGFAAGLAQADGHRAQGMAQFEFDCKHAAEMNVEATVPRRQPVEGPRIWKTNSGRRSPFTRA
jgi:hypothetical protein